MVKIINHKFKYSYIINIIFIAIIVIACLWDLGSLQRIRDIDDEFCYWGIAAVISGYDWTDLIAVSDYYSYGYSIILVPFFWLYRLVPSMGVIYRLAIVLNAFFLCGIYFMALYMLRELCDDLPDSLKKIISLAAALYIGNTAQMDLTMSETFLCFMFWCVIVCLCQVIKKPGYGNLSGLIFTTAALFAVHMRSLGVVIAVGIVLFCFFIANRKELDKKYAFFAVGIAAVFCGLVLLMKNYVSDNIYLGNAARSINNFQYNIDHIGHLLSVRGILDLAVSIIGKLFYISSATFLLALVGALAAATGIFRTLWKQKETNTRRKWQIKEWVSAFALLSFLAEVGISAIFKCPPIFLQEGSDGRFDTLVFGRYSDFVIGPMLILGAYAVFRLEAHYKEIFYSILAAGFCTGAVQFAYYFLAFQQGRDSVSFRLGGSPWLVTLADDHKIDFACYVMLVSICALAVLCMARLSKAFKWYGFGAILMLMIAVWTVAGVNGGIKYTASKSEKEKFVDTVAEILKTTGEETPLYIVGPSNSEVKILQWLLVNRSIHTCSLEDLNDIDLEDAVLLANSYETQLISKLSDRLDFLYDSGTLCVFTERGNSAYEAISEKAGKMAYVSNPKKGSITLSNVVTELSYTNMRGQMYYNYQSSDGGYMTKEMGVTLADGVYDFTIDMRAIGCEADTEVGYITVGDVNGNVQYTQSLNADDFINKPRQDIHVLAEVRDWAEPVIGIYTYGQASIKIFGISYQKKVGNIQLDSEEITEIAAFLEGQGGKEVIYIDSNNSGLTGFPWWEYGKLKYLSGQMLTYKENFAEAYYIVEKTDEDVIDFCQNSMQILMETDSYAVFIITT